MSVPPEVRKCMLTISGGGRLPEDVYRQINAVDQVQSTLTRAGAQGISARILDRGEIPSVQGGETYVVQLVEIIKKPGQSIGVYLREGNGIDKANGVFASRFGDNSELEKYGDVIRPGDEILSINNVEVSNMAIDDLVFILSTPRRLLLRIKYNKNRRNQPWMGRSTASDRPVVVFHKLEERRDSESASGSILAQPTNTANTWLGRKARQQTQEMGSRVVLPPAVRPMTSPRSMTSQYQPRLLNGQAQPMPTSRYENEPYDTVSRTARVPPPKMFSGNTVRRTESFNSAPGVMSLTQTLPRSSTAVPPPEDQRNPLSRSLCSPILPRSVRTNVDHKSARNVKWRTDVLSQADLYGEDDGTCSAPEYSASPMNDHGRMTQAFGQRTLSNGRTVNDIFSAAEYRNWAGPDQRIRPTRWSHTYGDQKGYRSISLPGRAINSQSLVGSPVLPRQQVYPERPSTVLDRYHVSPLMNRRAPLRAAGPGINVDRLSITSLTGILFVQILEGKGLRIPEKEKERTEEMYCVLEINDQHRARTGVTREIQREDRYRWRETFHIDVYNATILQFYIYSWHPQYRHKLWFRGSLRLLDKFIADHLTGDRMFSLNLEPRGQIHVRVGYHDMASVFRRAPSTRHDGVFGIPLNRLLQRERRETPIVLTRLIQELDKRGLDYVGIYVLCGAVEKKQMLREDLERNPLGTDLSLDSMPDTNVLACLIKDYLRELPEPLISSQIQAMLFDASAVILPNDVQANRQLIFRVIDCLQTPQRTCLMMVLDHLSSVLACAPHNGLTKAKISTIFGPLLMCSLDDLMVPPNHHHSPSTEIGSLDVAQASRALQLLIEHWPNRVSKCGLMTSSMTTSDASESDGDSPGAFRTLVSESQC